MSDQLDEINERQRNKNRSRLLNQNVKLNTEIRKLEQEMSELVAARQAQMISTYQKNNADLSKIKEEIVMQEKYIKKLKSKVEFLKSTNIKTNSEFIVKEEDDLRIVKKEYERLVLEKATVTRFREDKEKKLERNEPLMQHKVSLEDNLAEVKKSNRTMQAEITQLEREVRKYHNFIVLNKNLGRDKLDASSLKYEIAETDHELKKVLLKSKEIEDKWKPQLEALDREMLDLRANFDRTQKKLEEVEREHRTWQIRSNGLREEQEVEEYRDRLSKISLLPEDKKFSLPQSNKKIPSRVWNKDSNSPNKPFVMTKVATVNEKAEQQDLGKQIPLGIKQSPEKESKTKDQSYQIQQQPERAESAANKNKMPSSLKAKGNQRKQKQKQMKQSQDLEKQDRKSKLSKEVKFIKNDILKTPQTSKKTEKKNEGADKKGTPADAVKNPSNQKMDQKSLQKSKTKENTETKSEQGAPPSTDKKKNNLSKQKSDPKIPASAKTPNNEQKIQKGAINTKKGAKLAGGHKEQSPNPKEQKQGQSSRKKEKEGAASSKKPVKLLLKSVGVGTS